MTLNKLQVRDIERDTKKAEQYLEKIENKMIKVLRDHYKQNYRNGRSDESFLLWIEQRLKELK